MNEFDNVRQTISVRAPLAIGTLSLAILVGVIGSWSLVARISGAVVANGTIESTPKPQVINSLAGGIVSDVLVRDGDQVEKDELLVRFDTTALDAQLAAEDEAYYLIRARKTRLEAERRGQREFVFDHATLGFGKINANVAFAIQTQRKLFASRLELYLTKKRLLWQENSQYDIQVNGLASQKDALTRQLELAEIELTNARSLLKRGVTTVTLVNQKETMASEIRGRIAALTAKIADIRGKQISIKTKVLSISTSRENEAGQELESLAKLESEIEKKRKILRRQISESRVRSPIAGTVFNLRPISSGIAVQPFQVLMVIIPRNRELIASVKISPKNIQHIKLGQEVVLKFPGFSGRQTPGILGKTFYVSEDSAREKPDGASFYTARVKIPDFLRVQGEMRRLLPGMVVEVFFQKEPQRPLQFLTQPLGDYFARVFVAS